MYGVQVFIRAIRLVLNHGFSQNQFYMYINFYIIINVFLKSNKSRIQFYKYVKFKSKFDFM